MTAGPEDIAAMRADGDLLDFVRSLAAGTAPKKPPADEPPDDIEISISRPGAWPTGTHAPDAVPAVREALARWWPERHGRPA